MEITITTGYCRYQPHKSVAYSRLRLGIYVRHFGEHVGEIGDFFRLQRQIVHVPVENCLLIEKIVAF